VGTAGKLTAGDSLILTYSELMTPGSISAGWDGSALGVTLRLRDGKILGLASTADTVDVLRGSAAVNLGSVDLRQDFIVNNVTALFPTTMTAATTTNAGGASVTRITLVLGAPTSGSASLNTVATAATMSWSPSTLATDLAGLAASATAAAETGTADRDF
jgi:hypothetical protein